MPRIFKEQAASYWGRGQMCGRMGGTTLVTRPPVAPDTMAPAQLDSTVSGTTLPKATLDAAVS